MYQYKIPGKNIEMEPLNTRLVPTEPVTEIYVHHPPQETHLKHVKVMLYFMYPASSLRIDCYCGFEWDLIIVLSANLLRGTLTCSVIKSK